MWELTAEAGKRFVVHEDVLASQSQRLKDIIDAFTAAEPKPVREIPLDNWDADTVGRFVEYIYTSDYQSPDPVLPSTSVMTPEGSNQSVSSNAESPVDATSVPSTPEKVEEKRPLTPPIRPLTPLSECFPDGPDPPQRPSAAETFAAKYFDPSEHDFEEVFLAHAKIFALAWEFEVEALQKLAVQRLLRTFINIGSFQPDWPVASNFVELASYAYFGNNTADNDLRKIVSQFAALNFTALQTDEMKVLIEQSGGFARDLTAKVCRRLIIAEKDRDHEQKEREGLKLRLRSTRTELKEEREKSVGLGEMIEKVVERKVPPPRPNNPLAARRPFGNAVSAIRGNLFPLTPTPSAVSAVANAPPPPPKSIFFDTHITAVDIFGNPVIQLATKMPAGGSAVYPTSSQPGAKSIFESGSLFAGSGTKSIFDGDRTPKARVSGSYGLFDTPPMSRSTSALAPVSHNLEIGSSLDPVKQPTPVKQPITAPNLFGRPSVSTTTSIFGGVKPTEISGGLFGNASPFGSTGPTQIPAGLFGGSTKTTTATSAGGFFGNNSAGIPSNMFGR